jgi:hypothetical protein
MAELIRVSDSKNNQENMNMPLESQEFRNKFQLGNRRARAAICNEVYAARNATTKEKEVGLLVEDYRELKFIRDNQEQVINELKPKFSIENMKIYVTKTAGVAEECRVVRENIAKYGGVSTSLTNFWIDKRFILK